MGRWWFLVFGGLVVMTLAVVNLLIWPNTYLAQTRISFRTRNQVREFMADVWKQPIKIRIGEALIETSYDDLDIEVSIGTTMEALEVVGPGERMLKWATGINGLTLIQPVVRFGSDFERRVNNLISQKTIDERAVFDREKNIFRYYSDGRAQKVDAEDFRRQVITNFGQTDRVLEVAIVTIKSDLEKRVEKANRVIGEAMKTPMEVVMKRDGNEKRLVLQKKDFDNLLLTEIKDLTIPIEFKLDAGRLGELLTKKFRINLPVAYAASQIENELTARQTTGSGGAIILAEGDGPNSSGTESTKYIEVDISAQKMFLFENGKLLKSYPVSTGLYYPTPTGKYKIMNKLNLGYSGIFNVYMPYWMAFNYAADLGAYLGIHELPYKLKDGERFYRFGNYIGQKKTGGCIALAPGDSREVYDFASADMEVLVFN